MTMKVPYRAISIDIIGYLNSTNYYKLPVYVSQGSSNVTYIAISCIASFYSVILYVNDLGYSISPYRL